MYSIGYITTVLKSETVTSNVGIKNYRASSRNHSGKARVVERAGRREGVQWHGTATRVVLHVGIITITNEIITFDFAHFLFSFGT